ncbi:uncharacterized protein KD926_009815 [Aspergillus affinis]|uniref:uncharacterized protein n=1 Tax=Aspergillus affinis TaxID=1070780 RepID=UPI0022FDE3C1|nr:uncharacterized protein KD926_009815 [Aspergillus affinis]KAI9039181.1 hypothetical protein KD926_009815 [Aspergillus affinis]
MAGVHPQLQDPATAGVVASFLTSLNDLFVATNHAFDVYDSNSTRPAAKQQPVSSKLNIKSRLKWAATDNVKLSSQLKEFEFLVQRLYLLVPLDSLQPDQFQKLQDTLVQSQRSHAISRILRWLDAPSDDIFDACCSTRLETTCNWITTHSTYVSWLSNSSTNSSKVLWVHGPPAFGKSVLCAYIVQELRNKTQFPVYYIFCSAESESLRDPSSILRTWIYQALYNEESVLEAVLQYLETCERTRATYSDLCHLLREALSHIPDAIFAVDGLDECPRSGTFGLNLRYSRSDVLHDLMELLSGSNARMLVVSRDEGDIRSEVGLHAATRPGLALSELAITRELVTPDIERFTKHVVTQKLPGKTDEFQQELAAQMAMKCDGMFLLVRLQSRDLRPLKGNKQLRRMVNDMPTELARVYERDWKDIQTFSNVDRQRAEAILRWVTFAQRSLTITELSEAVAVLDNDEDDGPKFDDLPDPFDQGYVHSEVLGLCGSFLELRSSGTATDWESQTVHLIHFSAVNFLAGQQQTAPFADTMLQNYYLALDCLKYLDQEQSWRFEDDKRSHIIQQRCFSKYAIAAWYEHVNRSHQYQNKIQPHLMSFFKLPNASWDNWRKQYEASQATPSASSGSERGYPQNQDFPGGRMYYAALFGLREVAECLHNRGMAGIDDLGGFYGTPVQAASSQGNMDALLFLLKQGADILSHGRYGSALHAAATYNREETVRRLLKHGASVSATDNHGRTPLYIAVSFGNHATAQILIDGGAEISSGEKTGFTPLHFAIHLGDLEMVKMLLRNGADHSMANDEGNTPLHLSAWHGHTEVSRLLLEAGADVKSTNRYGYTALSYAAFDGHVEICQLLLGLGADHTVADQNGLTPLHVAAEGGCTNGIINLLLDLGADPEAQNKDGHTPLYLAARHGHFELVKSLLEYGADTAAVDNKGRSPIHFAAQHSHREVVEVLLNSGADITASDSYGNTPLHCASYSGQHEVVQLLLHSGADISAVDAAQWTPLYSATVLGNAEIVQLLIESGAEVNSRADDGTTPLHVAFRNRHEGTVLVLLDNQASLDCLDYQGLPPWQYASAQFRAKIPQCSKIESSTGDPWEKFARQTIRNLARRMVPMTKKNASFLSDLSKYLTQIGDFASASIVHNQNIVVDATTGDIYHGVICNSCHDSIVGIRYPCNTCVDYDLCHSCMSRYGDGGASFGACTNHEFLRVPSEDCTRDQHTDVYTKEFVSWLKELALKYRSEDP